MKIKLIRCTAAGLKRCYRQPILLIAPVFLLAIVPAHADLTDLPDTIVRIKKGIVGIGTMQKTRRPPAILTGTGFVVADGRHVMTNAHTIPKELNEKRKEFLAVFIGQGRTPELRAAQVVAVDERHDLAILKFGGKALSPLRLANDVNGVREGELYAFTGYPLGAVLGLYAATNRGIISAVTPIIIPMAHGQRISSGMIKYLEKPFIVFQLDATAYPGNSGSPLYDTATGWVIGIINMVFVKGIKENAITNPSGITYAIPVSHARKLLESSGLKP
ncbi:Serine protease precursor MucD/AlgY associated with sigma factor RpoE [Olavius algarvensis Delta 1 endosymbiont]|nr:Serine protease precursor MucD/AlgY associated with sigma factor RpoE [Olavius algarvensis Delta 1 endosymbiont]